MANSATAPPLFRPEVLDAHAEPTFGATLLVRPVSVAVLVVCVTAAAAATALLGIRGEYTRKAHVAGYLVPSGGLLKIYSPDPGTIVEKHVSEGRRVSKGDALFVISMERSSRQTAESQAAAMMKVRERRASLADTLAQHDRMARIDADGLQRRLNAMDAEIGTLAREVETGEMSVASARSTLRMYQDLHEKSLASAEQAEAKRKEFLDQQARLQSLQRTQIALGRERDTLAAQMATLAVKAVTDRSVIERDISVLDQQLTEHEAKRTIVVTAPSDGTATAVLADVGQMTSATQPLVSLLPTDTSLRAELFVPSRSIGFITTGQAVAMRYQAFPYQRFGSYTGRVAEISRTLILPGETIVPFALPEPAYRVIVELDGQAVRAYGRQYPLQSGMQLDANIELDRRRLYQWVLDPLYSVRGRL